MRSDDSALQDEFQQGQAVRSTLVELRAEIDGLRTSAQLRAVIEQAKGILVERHHINLDDAFGMLRQLSQEHNARLVEVAATIVGVALPGEQTDFVGQTALCARLPKSGAESRAWLSLRDEAGVRSGVAAAVLDSIAGATENGDQAAGLLQELLADQSTSAVAIYRTAVDGQLRLVGQVGIPGDLMSAWRRVPPSPEIPLSLAARDGVAMFWGSRQERSAAFPVTSRIRSDSEATAAIPVLQDGVVLGLVALIWNTQEDFEEVRRASITGRVQRVAPLLIRNASATDPDLDWINTLLKLQLDPWLLLDVVTSKDGEAMDFVIQDTAPGQPAAADWLGRRLLENWPALASDGTLMALKGLLRGGGVRGTTVATPGAAPWSAPGTRVRAVRLGRRIVILWRTPD